MQEGLRCQGDLDLAAILEQDPHIQKWREAREKEKTDETRRYLLSSSVRITESMAPTLHETVAHCRTTLAIEEPVEIYVSPSPHFNAFSYGSDRGIAFVGVTSSLLESFPSTELAFVIGHELGHYKFDHHAIPVGAILHGGGVKAEQALRLFSWQRYAEISADRAGLVCSENVDAVGRAFFRIASGLKSKKLVFDIEAYLKQIGDIQTEAARARKQDKQQDKPRADWFASHPFSPLRIRAAQLAATSVLCTDEGLPLAQLEANISELMALMEPSYLVDKSPTGEAMRRLLFAGGVMIAAAHNDVDERERAALEQFLGFGNVPQPLNPDALAADMAARIDNAKQHVPPLRRAQVIRDLCVIAFADGNAEESEVAIILDIASKIGVPSEIVDQGLLEATRPLD